MRAVGLAWAELVLAYVHDMGVDFGGGRHDLRTQSQLMRAMMRRLVNHAVIKTGGRRTTFAKTHRRTSITKRQVCG